MSVEREPRDRLGTVVVWLLATSSGEMQLTRMISGTAEISDEDWNGIAESFASEVLCPAAAGDDGIRWTLGDIYERPSNWFTPAAVRLLGSAIDRGGLERRRDFGWLEFLAQVHADGEGLDDGNLGRWLCETQGLAESDADEMMEFSHDVLSALESYDVLLGDRAERAPAA